MTTTMQACPAWLRPAVLALLLILSPAGARAGMQDAPRRQGGPRQGAATRPHRAPPEPRASSSCCCRASCPSPGTCWRTMRSAAMCKALAASFGWSCRWARCRTCACRKATRPRSTCRTGKRRRCWSTGGPAFRRSGSWTRRRCWLPTSPTTFAWPRGTGSRCSRPRARRSSRITGWSGSMPTTTAASPPRPSRRARSGAWLRTASTPIAGTHVFEHRDLRSWASG
jgi:hypothetical protein